MLTALSTQAILGDRVYLSAGTMPKVRVCRNRQYQVFESVGTGNAKCSRLSAQEMPSVRVCRHRQCQVLGFIGLSAHVVSGVGIYLSVSTGNARCCGLPVCRHRQC